MSCNSGRGCTVRLLSTQIGKNGVLVVGSGATVAPCVLCRVQPRVTVVGQDAIAYDRQATAIGNCTAAGFGSVALGHRAIANAASTAIGTKASALGGGTAIGVGAVAETYRELVIQSGAAFCGECACVSAPTNLIRITGAGDLHLRFNGTDVTLCKCDALRLFRGCNTNRLVVHGNTGAVALGQDTGSPGCRSTVIGSCANASGLSGGAFSGHDTIILQSSALNRMGNPRNRIAIDDCGTLHLRLADACRTYGRTCLFDILDGRGGGGVGLCGATKPGCGCSGDEGSTRLGVGTGAGKDSVAIGINAIAGSRATVIGANAGGSVGYCDSIVIQSASDSQICAPKNRIFVLGNGCLHLRLGCSCHVYSPNDVFSALSGGGGGGGGGACGLTLGCHVTVVGSSASYSGNCSGEVVIGHGATSLAEHTVAIGDTATVTGYGGIAVGNSAYSNGNGLAIGESATALCGEIVIQTGGLGAVRNRIRITPNGCLYLRLGCSCRSYSSSGVFSALSGGGGGGGGVCGLSITCHETVVGASASYLPCSSSVVIGAQASAVQDLAVVIGHSAAVPMGCGGVAVGARAISRGGVAVGADANSCVHEGVAVGSSAISRGAGVAVGFSADSSPGGVVVGAHAISLNQGLALGDSASALCNEIVIQTGGLGDVRNRIRITQYGCLHIRLGCSCRKISAAAFFSALGL